MTTAMSGTPRITELTVVPVAGQDSMLMNLSGAHGPWFTRNILILKDSAGHVGVGEVPGGEAIRQTLDDARALLVGEPIGQYNALLGKVRRSTSAKAQNLLGWKPRGNAEMIVATAESLIRLGLVKT